ncbi:MAG: hypothetical protein KAU83_10340, partial [Bacteroidales bacterium]|nr:hypothetical protein [Bacteroidales bacterium]
VGSEFEKQVRAGNNVFNEEEFPKEMVEFVPYEANPIFEGTGLDTWDKQIRERGYILYDEGIFKLWYSGYNKDIIETIFLGYATSTDGINWTRYPGNPIFSDYWTEDMQVVKHEGKYYMFAEGENDIAHLLTSNDGINWKREGDLDIRQINGDPISPGPYGTPTVMIENGKWYLFYERNDEGIWLAESKDHVTWTNVQDDPVIKMGPEEYDAGAVAVNQVVKFKGRYYIFYHGSSNPDWANPASHALWTSNVAMSTDLTHWVKYPENPIVEGDHSSPIMVFDGKQYRLFTMHAAVCVYYPKESE